MWNHEHVLKLHNGVPYVDPCFFFLLQRQMKNTRVFHVYCDYFENSIFGKFSYVKKLFTNRLLTEMRARADWWLLQLKMKRQIALFIGVVIFLTLICPLSSGTNTQANPSGDDWPMFHHDPAHTGYASFTASLDAL
jgi:hypothetical protein